VFVRHALPGERVRAVVTEGRDRDRYLRADAVDVLTASPDRVDAPCPYARPGACGGCDWQHASLPAQRRLKAAVVEEQLRRLARLDLPVEVEEVPGARDGLGWRTRVQFAVDPAGRAGLRRHRSHDVVPVDRCLIAHPLLEQIGVEGRRWPGVASVEAVISAEAGERTVVVRPLDPATRVRLPRLDPEVSVLLDTGAARREKLRGRGRLHEQAVGRSWRVSAGGFWQVHPGAADALTAAVLDMLEPREGERALDLYAGVGLFAGALATRLGSTGRVTAVESDARAATDARRNLHDTPWVRIVEGRVDRVLRRDLAPVDLVVLDPPRSGAGRAVVDAVTALAPRAVAYVACDPAALARDVALLAGQGYELRRLRAFDIFPMTHHVEVVALLVRAGCQGR